MLSREAEYESDMLPLNRSLKCCNRPTQLYWDTQWNRPSSLSICTSAREAGALHCGCICNKNKHQATTIHQLASWPRSNRSRLLLTASGQERALLCVPSHCTSAASTNQDTRQASSSSCGSSWIPRPNMDTTLRSGTCKSIDLGTEALVPNQAAAELPRNTRMIAYLWRKLEPSLELHSAKAHGQSMTMPSDNGQPSA